MNLHDELNAFNLQCTGIVVFKGTSSVDCIFLNTNAEAISATRVHLPIPLTNKRAFTFYLNTARQGKGNISSHCDNIMPYLFYRLVETQLGDYFGGPWYLANMPWHFYDK